MSIRLNAALGGSISIEETNTASNITLTIPAVTGNFVVADATGKVGIATSSPSSQLTIGRADSSFEGGQIDFCRSTDNATTWSIDVYGNTSTPDFRFINAIAGSEKMRLTYAGSLLINTGSSIGFSALLEVNAGDVAAHFRSTAAAGFGITMVCERSAATGGEQVRFRTSGTTVGAISSTATTTSYATSSDYRLKENPQPLLGALERVMQLAPKEWKWKVDGSQGFGFIAHEVQTIRPQAVTGTKDAVDKDGNPVYQSMDASFLIADLTGAIQEQQKIINELKSRIEALEQV